MARTSALVHRKGMGEIEVEQRDLITSLVMDSIANDYEDYPMILEEVTNWAMERGVRVSPTVVSDCLADLIEKGFAKAYSLATGKPEELIWDPSQVINESFFLLTEQGREAIVAY